MAHASAGAAPPGPGEVLLSATRARRHRGQVPGRLGVDVTLAQVRTLMLPAGSGPQRAVDVATELSVNPSTGTRMCDRLVRNGLARRTAAPETVKLNRAAPVGTAPACAGSTRIRR